MAKGSELQKHTLNLRAGDYEELQDMFPDLGAGPVIRKLVHEFVERARSNVEFRNSTRMKIEI